MNEWFFFRERPERIYRLVSRKTMRDGIDMLHGRAVADMANCWTDTEHAALCDESGSPTGSPARGNL